jgi:hypothetical protein
VTTFASPEELIVFLDLAAGTQPMDRPVLVLGIVSAAIRDVTGWTTAGDPAPVPDGIKGVCLRYAAALYGNPSGAREEEIDDYRRAYPLARAVRADPDLAPYLPVLIA